MKTKIFILHRIKFFGTFYIYMIDNKFKSCGSFSETLLDEYEKIFDVYWKIMKDLDNYIKRFKEKYGEQYYSSVETNSGLIGKKIELKPKYTSGEVFKGEIVCLWLPKDEKSFRDDDLWYVKWLNGKDGVIELKQIIFI